MNKREAAFDTFRKLFAADIEDNERHRATAQFDANEAEGRMISRYDTFKEEAQFLAVGHEMRLIEREGTLALIDAIRKDCLVATDRVLAGALVTTEDGDGIEALYYLIPGGSGKKIIIDGKEYTCVAPNTPMGKSLIGKKVDDVAIVVADKVRRELTITNIE